MIYSFLCDPEDNGCGHSFEISCWISEYDAAIKGLKCPKCNNKESIRRNYEVDTINTSVIKSDSEITIGHLAERNSKRMSDEQKAKVNYEHNKYLFENPAQDLPAGMQRLRKKPIDGKYYPPQARQRKRKIKKKENKNG
jgi:hypothetical protein